jgi:hypothetical protein
VDGACDAQSKPCRHAGVFYWDIQQPESDLAIMWKLGILNANIAGGSKWVLYFFIDAMAVFVLFPPYFSKF